MLWYSSNEQLIIISKYEILWKICYNCYILVFVCLVENEQHVYQHLEVLFDVSLVVIFGSLKRKRWIYFNETKNAWFVYSIWTLKIKSKSKTKSANKDKSTKVMWEKCANVLVIHTTYIRISSFAQWWLISQIFFVVKCRFFRRMH